MSEIYSTIKSIFFIAIISIVFARSTLAEEIVVQQEEMSFERCLKVIITSENKLSIAPKINDQTDKIRVAVFTLADGTLTIRCDGEKKLVTVLTNTN